jgi:hypothetical protein
MGVSDTAIHKRAKKEQWSRAPAQDYDAGGGGARPDWHKSREAYEAAGTVGPSIREIARQHGIPESTIRRTRNKSGTAGARVR